MKIQTIQEELKEEGLYAGPIDGVWGPATMRAFLSLQRKKGVIIPRAVEIAAGDLWIKEEAGHKTNPRIQEFHNHTNLQASEDEVAWCSSAMNCWQEESGLVGTRSAAARSWLEWGRKLNAPQFGCVAILRRGNSEWQGHVAFYMAGDADSILLLGGNQSNSVNVQSFSRSSVLGYRI